MIDPSVIQSLAEERMAELGDDFFIVSLNVHGGNKIIVEVDRMNSGISIADCMSISRNIEHNLDREVEDFALEVTSAGLDKPFRVKKQYEKNIGNDIKVVFEHGKLEGVLKSVEDDFIIVEETRKEKLEGKKKKVQIIENIEVPFEKIKNTFVKLKFK